MRSAKPASKWKLTCAAALLTILRHDESESLEIREVHLLEKRGGGKSGD